MFSFKYDRPLTDKIRLQKSQTVLSNCAVESCRTILLAIIDRVCYFITVQKRTSHAR
nr:MAG TPA: hypothetical protein [Caudoviricetes sp.]